MRQRLEAPAASGAGGHVIVLLVAFIAIWTAFSSLSRYNLDVHGDMVENFAWGIGWQLGYFKHPPLFAWISAAWFTIFPRSDTLYFLLSSTNIAATIFVMWRISLRYFDPNQQILLVGCALMLPPLTFLSTNYNATSAMLPFWALIFLFYLRTIENRSARDAAMLGVFAGLAMLAKYHSMVVLLAVAIHALFDRDVRTLVATRLPWVVAAAGLLTLAPHLYWMVATDFQTIVYASDQGTGSWSQTLIYAVRFIPAILLYSAPGYLLLVLHRSWNDGFPVVEPEQFRALWRSVRGRALLGVAILPIFITIALGLMLNAQVSSLWSIPFFVFLPFLMVLCLPSGLAWRQRTVVPLTLGVYAVLLLTAAPAIRDAVIDNGRSNSTLPIDYVAGAVQERWRERTGTPLSIVAAETNFLSNGMAFYAPDRPFAIQGLSLGLTPWVSNADIEREGAVVLCDAATTIDCPAHAKRLLRKIDGVEVVIVPPLERGTGLSRWNYQIYFRDPAK